MLSVKLITVGKLKEKCLKDALDEYLKRLSGLCRISHVSIDECPVPENPGAAEIGRRLELEGKKIMTKLDKGTYVVAMCVEGESLSSEELAKKLGEIAAYSSSSVAVIIGGSYGLSDEIKKRSELRLSMSRMTFPHQLAGVMAAEQLYRALSINTGSKYHK